MKFYYNPLDTACKSVVGATHKSEEFNIFVKTDGEGECLLVLRRDDWAKAISYPMQRVSGGFFVRLNELDEGLYWYYFSLNGVAFGKGKKLFAEKHSGEAFQHSVLPNDFKTPKWLVGGIIYQIFPDRFYKSKDFEVEKGKVKNYNWNAEPVYRNTQGKVLNNEFFGGNLEGIAEKLDYLKSLGVSCIYLNPISKAFSSHRYDTGDYLTVDSVLGDWESVKNLSEKANLLGIKLVFDGVYNHTGADSVYFNKYSKYNSVGAYNSQNSPYYDWFTFKKYPDKYESWWDFENLPSIKKQCESYQNFICKEVIPKYIQNGFSGVRLDVVDELDEKFVKNIRNAITENNPDGFVIGEVWEDATNKIAYSERRNYFTNGELDSVMNYPLKDSIINFLLSGEVSELESTVCEQINNYPKCVLDVLMNVLSTHDSPRIITVLGRRKVVSDKDLMKYESFDSTEYAKGVKLAKCAYVLTYFLYGVPSVYYGDEAGVFGDLDPYNRKTFPWGKEDGELVEFFKKLAEIRSSNSVFFGGETKILYAENGVFVFERKNESKQVFVAVSRRDRDVFLNFSKTTLNLITGENESEKVSLRKDGFLILASHN